MKKRTFESGATRDVSLGKIHYYGFQHPLCDYSFGRYMNVHRKQKDGTLREPDNWWGGWDKKISLDSMARHVEDLKLIHAGYYVYKLRYEDLETGGIAEETIVKTEPVENELLELVTEDDACNAIRFNADAYKLEVLKEKK